MALSLWRKEVSLALSFSFAVASVVVQPHSASSQSSPAPDVRAPGSGEFAPRGQRIARDIKYGTWQKFCFKPAGTNAVCRTTISGTFETGQTAVRVDLVERDGENTARLQLFLPVGIYLKSPASLTVDKGPAYQLPFVWCLTNGCIAADVADASLVKEMETGQTLLLRIVDTSIISVTTEISLKDFATTRRNAPTKIFEQAIDE
ncbi:invasion associated locus B family protein [Bradyrhizobium sp. SYSU BS000235]|uniref:invasion associated locus B family protein n=1 Tax=Bradyrhizobium sp. SYSU BS000235 TaxID=3411332 RepID=UPI003C70F44C